MERVIMPLEHSRHCLTDQLKPGSSQRHSGFKRHSSASKSSPLRHPELQNCTMFSEIVWMNDKAYGIPHDLRTIISNLSYLQITRTIILPLYEFYPKFKTTYILCRQFQVQKTLQSWSISTLRYK